MIREPHTSFQYPGDEVSNSSDTDRRDALEMLLVLNCWLLRKSRTLRSQSIRREILLNRVLRKYSTAQEMCRRLRISRSRYYAVLRELRRELGMSKVN